VEFGEFTLCASAGSRSSATTTPRRATAVGLTARRRIWLQEKARHVRQGFMDPKQKAAFEEFLARQASLDEP
jgi:hypothetical protein